MPPQFDKRVWREIAAHGPLVAIIADLFLTLLAVAGMETSVTLHARDRFGFRADRHGVLLSLHGRDRGRRSREG